MQPGVSSEQRKEQPAGLQQNGHAPAAKAPPAPAGVSPLPWHPRLPLSHDDRLEGQLGVQFAGWSEVSCPTHEFAERCGWCMFLMPSREGDALRCLVALQGARAAEALSDASPGRNRKGDASAEPFTSRRPRLTECSEVRTALCIVLLQCHASSLHAMLSRKEPLMLCPVDGLACMHTAALTASRGCHPAAALRACMMRCWQAVMLACGAGGVPAGRVRLPPQPGRQECVAGQLPRRHPQRPAPGRVQPLQRGHHAGRLQVTRLTSSESAGSQGSVLLSSPTAGAGMTIMSAGASLARRGVQTHVTSG